MIPYIGGKSLLSGWIQSNFPENFRELVYCEVFGGGGWVLFKKDDSYLEIYNDLNKDLVNLFRIIRDNYEEFQHRAEWSLHSREMFQEAKLKLKDDKFLSEVERAMHYALSQVQSFGGNSSSWGYQVTADKITSGQWQPFLKRMQLINARLKRVQIECLDFQKCIKKYDTRNTFFYLDPPYYGAEFYYNNQDVCFTQDDHCRLATLLKNIQGKFMLSYYDHEYIRDLYAGYKILIKKSVKNSCGVTRTYRKERPKSIELLIMNY